MLSPIWHLILLLTAWQCQPVICPGETPWKPGCSACLREKREKSLLYIHYLVILLSLGFLSVKTFPSVSEEALQFNSLLAPEWRTGNSWFPSTQLFWGEQTCPLAISKDMGHSGWVFCPLQGSYTWAALRGVWLSSQSINRQMCCWSESPFIFLLLL